MLSEYNSGKEQKSFLLVSAVFPQEGSVSVAGLTAKLCSTARKHLCVTGFAYKVVHWIRFHGCGSRNSLSSLRYNYLMKSYKYTVRDQLSGVSARPYLACLHLFPNTSILLPSHLCFFSVKKRRLFFFASLYASKLSLLYSIHYLQQMLKIDKCSRFKKVWEQLK